jgi:hypothetical protein
MLKKMARILGWTLIWSVGLTLAVALPIAAIYAGDDRAGPVVLLGADVLLAGALLICWSDS